jgi:hypothetical protein
MPQRIEFDGKTHEFPDDFTPAEIQQALQAAGKPAAAAAQPEQVDTGETFLGELGKSLNPVTAVKGVAQAAMNTAAIAQGISHLDPRETVQAVVKSAGPLVALQADQIAKVKESYAKGDYTEAFGHLLAALPVIGPAAAEAGEAIGGTPPEYDKFGNIVRPGIAPNFGAGLGKATGLLAQAAAPALVGKGVAKVQQVASKTTAPWVYRSGLGVPPLTDPAKVNKAVEGAFEHQIRLTEKGAASMEQNITRLNDAVRSEIASRPGVTIDRHAVAEHLDELAARYAKQVNPKADLETIAKVKQEFLEMGGATPTGLVTAQGTPVMSRAQPIPALEAQDLKTGTYAINKGKYGKVSDAQIEAEKALAHGLMTELNNAFPEVVALNAKQGRLLELKPLLERRLRQMANADELPVHMTPTGNALGIMAKLIASPGIKSRLALWLHEGSKRAVPMSQATARVTAFLNQLEQQTPETPQP